MSNTTMYVIKTNNKPHFMCLNFSLIDVFMKLIYLLVYSSETLFEELCLHGNQNVCSGRADEMFPRQKLPLCRQPQLPSTGLCSAASSSTK